MKKSSPKKNSSGKSKKKNTVTQKLKRKIRALKTKVSRSKARRKKRIISSSRKKKDLTHQSPQLGITKVVIPDLEKEQVETTKFTTVEVHQEKPATYSLPRRYHDDRIVLLPRDPWWLHTYWDISEEKINQIISSIPVYERTDLKWVLRVYDVLGIRNFNGGNANSYFDVEINFDANNWYINVPTPEREWCVDIGLKTLQGKFFVVARSNIIKAPYFGISDIIDEEWAIGEEEYFKVLGVYDLGKSSLERRKKLEEIIKYQISSGAFSGGVSSLFSVMKKKEERKFFLEVWTELILYGRTEPTAEVKVDGKKVKLRGDGTFSLRYALPEGDFTFRVEATSEDKKDKIKVNPAVKRYSK